MDWINADPLESIDAQIDVLEVARDAFRVDLIDAEQLVIAAGAVGDRARVTEQDARVMVDRARQAVRDYSAEIDELQTERRLYLLLPGQRRPAAGA